MKKIIPILLFVSTIASAQNLLCTRTIDALSQSVSSYDVSGSVVLEKYDNGKVYLKTQNNFVTETGARLAFVLCAEPTIRYKTASFSNKDDFADDLDLVIVHPRLVGSQHSGVHSYEVSSNVDINDYPYLILQCMDFKAPYTNGSFDDECSCKESATATTRWASSASICPGDNEADEVEIVNGLMDYTFENLSYLVTDDNLILQEVVNSRFHDFDNSGTETNRVYAVSYIGTLNAPVGMHIDNITSTECAILSDETLYLTITKDACVTTGLENLEESATSYSLYPNPATDVIYFNEKVNTVQLFNNEGIQVLESSQVDELNIRALNSGFYIVIIDQIYQSKLTIE